MLCDERIETELSKLRKYIIILSVILGVIFLGFKIPYLIFYKTSLVFYITETSAILSGIFILIRATLIKTETKDELYYCKKHKYYNFAFKIHLLLVFLSFSLTLAGTAVREEGVLLNSSNYMSTTMLISLFFGYAYCRYKHIYFNYKIIELNNKKYYKAVFKNILKITGFFGVVYGIAIIPTFLYLNEQILNLFLAIFLAFIVSTLSNSIFYLVISFLEKRFLSEEYKKRITSPTLIMLIIGLVMFLSVAILNILFYLLYSRGITANVDSFTFIERLSLITRINNYLGEWGDLIGILGIVFLSYELTKGKDILRLKMNKVLLFFLIISALIIVYNKNNSVINGYFIDLDFYDSADLLSKIMFIKLQVTEFLKVLLLIVVFIELGKYIKRYKSLVLMSSFWSVFVVLSLVNLFIKDEYIHILILALNPALIVMTIGVVIGFYCSKSNRIDKFANFIE